MKLKCILWLQKIEPKFRPVLDGEWLGLAGPVHDLNLKYMFSDNPPVSFDNYNNQLPFLCSQITISSELKI